MNTNSFDLYWKFLSKILLAVPVWWAKKLWSYEIYKEMILEMTKQRVIMINMRIVWLFDIKKIAYELTGSFAKVRAPQADKDSINPENLHKKFSC